eukprot:5479245-Pyramimonas_sp.AAC.1
MVNSPPVQKVSKVQLCTIRAFKDLVAKRESHDFNARAAFSVQLKHILKTAAPFQNGAGNKSEALLIGGPPQGR